MWADPMQSAPPAALAPSAVPAQAQLPAAAAAQAAPMSTAGALALADSAAGDVRAIAAAGERLVEVLADAAASTPSQLEHQVAALLQETMPALERAQAAWTQLQAQSATPQGGADAAAAAQAVQVSLALGSLLQHATPLGSRANATAAAHPAASLDRHSQAQALEQLVARVSLACGYAVRLMAAEPSAAGLPGKLRECGAADATQVHMTLGETLTGCVALAAPGSLAPVRAAVFSAEEADGGRASAWAQSQHHVFQRISAWAMQALGHFQRRTQQPTVSELAAANQALLSTAAAGAPLEDLLLWLATYDDLFTRPCAATATLLAADAASLHCFPPLIRPFGLTRQQLVDAAQCIGSDGACRGGGARSAYHPHAAPLAVLYPE